MNPFPTPWKHQKAVRFSDAFKGYGKGALATNGLITMKNYKNTPRKRLMIQLINFIFYGLFFEYISNLYHVRKLKMSVLSFSSVKLSLSVGIGFEIMPICACACRNPSGFTFKKVFRKIILARSNFLEKIFGCTTCDRSF